MKVINGEYYTQTKCLALLDDTVDHIKWMEDFVKAIPASYPKVFLFKVYVFESGSETPSLMGAMIHVVNYDSETLIS